MVTRGALSVRVGKQFIRWGKADILNPTDRFAPRDFLSVLDTEFLAVTGARPTLGLQSNSLDLVLPLHAEPDTAPGAAMVRAAGGPGSGASWTQG